MFQLFNFYKYNFHAIPFVRKLLCKIGSHDYEVKELTDKSAILYCFYCLHEKQSFLS